MARNNVPNRTGRSPFAIVFPNFKAAEINNFTPGYPLDDAIKTRFRVIEAVQSAVRSVDARQRLAIAINKKPPGRNFTSIYQPGQSVDYFDKKDSRWYGPYSVLPMLDDDYSKVFIRSGNRVLLRNVSNCRHHTFSDDELRALKSYYSDVNECFSVSDVFATTVEAANATGDAWLAADEKEANGLIARGTIKMVPDSEVPKDAKNVNSKVVRVIKDSGICKSRWVATEIGWKSDRVVERTVPTPSRAVLRVVLTVSLAFRWSCVI